MAQSKAAMGEMLGCDVEEDDPNHSSEGELLNRLPGLDLGKFNCNDVESESE